MRKLKDYLSFKGWYYDFYETSTDLMISTTNGMGLIERMFGRHWKERYIPNSNNLSSKGMRDDLLEIRRRARNIDINAP